MASEAVNLASAHNIPSKVEIDPGRQQGLWSFVATPRTQKCTTETFYLRRTEGAYPMLQEKITKSINPPG